MRTFWISFEDLERMAAFRPKGYSQDVLAHAEQVTDTHYAIKEDKYLLLRRKYRESGARAKWGRAARRIGHGAAGLLKSAVGIDKASEEIAGARLEICQVCDVLTPCLLGKAQCCGKITDVARMDNPGCGCIVTRKVKIATETCPLNKW